MKGFAVIYLKTDAEIDQMRPAGELAGELLDMIEEYVKPGVTTLELNDIVHNYTVKKGAVCAPLNYRGFPKSMCTSINDVVCHGIPSSKAKLKEGDIINIDVTPILGGYHGDTSRTYFVGQVSEKAKKLVQITKECLDRGIAEVKEGARVGDIGHAIQSYAEAQGYSVVRDFVGHGIGKVFHEDPQIFHYGEKGRGQRLERGMVFTIEPMINEGTYRTKVLKDGWTALTLDGSLSAQFEHTIAIRSDWSVEILTLSPKEKALLKG
ncbi:MAG: type I methionyl aminopeptidase [Proteobacteria bacterium]|nr:MAG: type I methionyl aminopeptidase [Pseudomonadota bacterium]